MMKTKYYSYKIGELPEGCKLCVQGRKLVLFVTGLCSRNCFYCPISDKKKNKDVTYANEWPIKNTNDLIKEAELTGARGAGFTGGDPLIKLDRTLSYIKLLKKRFGKKFHIHLYTSLDLADEKALKKLYDASLDEIRFHPDIYNNKSWYRIMLARKFDWDVGVEIPAIPGTEKETKQLIDFIKGKVDFFNINELEFSDASANQLARFGFVCKDNLSYGIKGSDKLAKKLLKYCKGKIKNVHYCTAKLKDKVQLSNRIKIRAKNVKKPYDIVTSEGTIYHGVVFTRDFNKVSKFLTKYSVPKSFFEYDKDKRCVLVAPWVLLMLKDDMKKHWKVALVEEYPTYDRLKVLVDEL
ncbi:MAG: radical SAM protein [Candidatus Nanoarchaeia archaeon]